MKYPFKSLLLAATVLAAASCAKDDTQSGGEETAGPVIVNASPAAIGGEIILKLKTEASGIVEKSRAQGVSKGSGIDEIDRILNTVNTVRFERLFPDGGRFEERTRREGLHLWYYAKYDPVGPDERDGQPALLVQGHRDHRILAGRRNFGLPPHGIPRRRGAERHPRHRRRGAQRPLPLQRERTFAADAMALQQYGQRLRTGEQTGRPTPTCTPPGSSRRAIPT